LAELLNKEEIEERPIEEAMSERIRSCEQEEAISANPRVLGSWKAVAQVNSIDEFDPARKADLRRVSIRAITFKDHGRIDNKRWIWSGDTLMDLDRYQALKMRVKG